MGKRIQKIVETAVVIGVAAVYAGEVRVTASVDRQSVAMGERLTLEIVVEGSQSASTPVFKELRGLRVVQGPATSTQVSIINGAMSSSVRFTYELVATGVGEQEIGPIEVRVGRQVYRTTPMKIIVTEQARMGGGVGAQAGKAVFLVLQADRTNVYVNEQFVVTATLYYRDVQVANVSQPEAALQGFEVYEQGYQQGEAVINNLRYRYVRFPMIVFPLQAGRQRVGPVRMKVSVREPVASRARGFFDDGFFGGGLLDEFFGRFQVVEHEIESDAVEVEVKEIPEAGRPAGYSGAVGEYELRAKVEPRSVQAGSAVTLTVELIGAGNINNVSMGMLTNAAELRVYDPESRR
ncbi:MAG: BatD family protein, partial [bacterium]|nr:BatD family protein [bacterium]